MRPLTRTEWIVQIVLCNLLLVIVGIFAIYFTACRANMLSRTLAEKAADEIAAGADKDAVLLSQPEQYLSYSVFFLPAASSEGAASSEEDASSSERNAFHSADGRDDIWAAENVLRDGESPVPPADGTGKITGTPSPEAEGPVVLRRYYGDTGLEPDSWLPSLAGFIRSGKSFYALKGSLHPFGMVSIAGSPVSQDKNNAATCPGYVFVARSLPWMPPLMAFYAVSATFLYYIVVNSLVAQKRSRDRVEQIYHQYIANISHELKSPIASIQAITEVLCSSDPGNLDETALSRYYGIISRESRLLEHSVLQIIELSKLQDHQMRFEKKPVSPHTLLDPVHERYQSRCEELGITFSIDESVWILPSFYTDAGRLTQLLEILLDNACKFVAEDGHIFIDATSRHGQATLRVNDDGRGISPKDFPHIFERFYKTNIDNPTGSGLGLAIASEIAAGLGEKLWVQSEEGKGTIFFITVATQQ